ncbi:MAG: NADH-quinone oxidoreductase subunit C [Verrucomicrobiae bacterium]|nr:NADH-quinone oxidoreductase subunit C [Verrucomicrobiae bacterium]
METAELVSSLRSRFGDAIAEPAHFLDELTLELKDPSILLAFAGALKHDHHFEMLTDICSIDHALSEPRFEVVYHAYSLKNHRRIRFKFRVAQGKTVPSLTSVWPAANWHEREVFDMMGIRFEGHPDLRRILMWEGYPHHPLLKDFPLAGKFTEDTRPAPLDGGPFVTSPGPKTTVEREPRGKGETFRRVT